jgi:4-amino-4-deoxy-L-arabinose transferase-like glycosyltransferase
MAVSEQLGSTLSQDSYHKARSFSLGRTAIIATFLAYAALSLFRLGTPDLDTDEGRYGISALNILNDYHQIAVVSPDPGGVPWSTWPYMYPMELAGSILVLGKNEFALRVVNVLLTLLTAWCIYRLALLLLKDRTTAVLASGLFLLNPATIAYARSAMAEPSVVFWGCAAMLAAASYWELGRPGYAALSGLALGLGFLSKLWLVLPFGAAVALLLLARLPKGGPGATARDVAIGLVAFLIVAGSHLFLLRLLSPENLTIWLGTYFHSSASTRVGGAGYDPNMWYRPWWFYFGALFKGVFFGLPLVFLGAADLMRRRRYLVLGCVAWLVGPAFVLSLFKVKEAAYVSQAYPALAILMACGVLPLFETAQPVSIALSALVSIALAAFFFAAGVVTKTQLAMMLALYFLYLCATPAKLVLPRWHKLAAVAAALAALLLTDAVVVQRHLSRRTHYREIAAYFQSRVPPLRPGAATFTSPEFAAVGFYLFRQGEYWETFYFHKDDAQFRDELEHGDRLFYVVDPTGTLYGGKIKPEWEALLAQNTRDVTAEIQQATGTKIGLRVLVPLAQPPTANNK